DCGCAGGGVRRMTPAALDRAAIETHQTEKVQALMRELLASNRFYAAKLRQAGVDKAAESLLEFRSRVPFTFKAELIDDQTANPPFGSNLTYAVEEYSRFHQTSGTTGKPMCWLDTPESWNWVVACWTRIYQVAGIGRHDRVFFPFSFGPFLGFW